MDENWVLRTHWSKDRPKDELLNREWLVTNGLGGYASGTLAGVGTRRYHGLLIAALPNPLGRQMMLNHLTELVRPGDNQTYLFGGTEYVGGKVDMHGAEYLTEFRLETGLPVWRYQVGDLVFEKRVFLPYRQNTAFINYQLVHGQGPLRLKLRLGLHFRSHDEAVSPKDMSPYQVVVKDQRLEVQGPAPLPPLRLHLHGNNSAFTLESAELKNILYRVEENRGYDSEGTLWCPGYFRGDLAEGQDVTLVASTEAWETIHALNPQEALEAEHQRRQRLIVTAHPEIQNTRARELILAADQFLVQPAGRIEDAARAHAAGDEVRSVIAGYHWFTDWGRDTMISLEGLTLTTGRHVEAGYILRTFAHYVRNGLIPNLFPEGQKEGLYHTADATLWYFHALDRYLACTRDRMTLQRILPKLLDIFEHHVRGTDFGIGVDPQDGLLKEGAAGYQLTWMDAKCGDWVVTPRRGKAVEINALWYNALCNLERWLREEGQNQDAERVGAQARQAGASFNKRFWYEAGGYLYDVVDCLPLGDEKRTGDDPSCRPNQVFAISLPNPVLEPRYWKPVMDTIEKKLLTPFGLRTLSQDNPEYKKNYHGDLHTRDAAYHQGTVWPWLIGPFVDAWVKLHPDDRAGARRFLEPLVQKHLLDDCVGSISEICDAEPPYTSRGCIAQAWSVAEVVRCWVKTRKE
jgi:predicted glycogen debranching enzyme